jgi:hypothetical protein
MIAIVERIPLIGPLARGLVRSEKRFQERFGVMALYRELKFFEVMEKYRDLIQGQRAGIFYKNWEAGLFWDKARVGFVCGGEVSGIKFDCLGKARSGELPPDWDPFYLTMPALTLACWGNHRKLDVFVQADPQLKQVRIATREVPGRTRALLVSMPDNSDDPAWKNFIGKVVGEGIHWNFSRPFSPDIIESPFIKEYNPPWGFSRRV